MVNPHDCVRCGVPCKCGGRVYRAVGTIVEKYERESYVIWNGMCCGCTGLSARESCDLCTRRKREEAAAVAE